MPAFGSKNEHEFIPTSDFGDKITILEFKKSPAGKQSYVIICLVNQ